MVKSIMTRRHSTLKTFSVWLAAKPTALEAEPFGLKDLEVCVLLLLFLVQVGLPMIGVQENFWLGLICWIGIVFLLVRVVWKWEGLRRLRNITRLLASAFVVTLVALYVYHPLARTFYLRVRPSFVFLLPGKDLADCERRAFVVKHMGARVLSNPEIVLWDNRAQRGTVTKYAELAPGEPDPVNPKYIWWKPASPWDEDYTVKITAGEVKVVQYLIARSARGQLQLATEVFVDDKRVFTCRDSLLPSSYTLASGTTKQCDSMEIPQEAIQKLSPESSSVQHADGSLTISRLRSMVPTPGIEGHQEARHIWEYQKLRLIRDLSKYADAKISLLASDTGTETWNYAQELAQVLRLAKWSVQGPERLPRVYDGMLDIQVSADDASPPRQEVKATLDALTSAGIKHRTPVTRDPGVARGLILLWIGSRSPDGINPDDCSGVVLKPPPDEQSRPCVKIAATPHYCPFPPQ